MTNPSEPSTQASLPQLMAACLGELRTITPMLERLVVQQASQLAYLDSIQANVDGFTNGGASFGAYQTDPYTNAYLAVLGPMLAIRLQSELGNKLIPELMKAGAPLARDMLEELAAYREQQFGRDILENEMSTVRDPWNEKAQPEENTTWEDLAEGS